MANVTFKQTFHRKLTHFFESTDFDVIPITASDKLQLSLIDFQHANNKALTLPPKVPQWLECNSATILQIEVKHASRGLSAIAELLVCKSLFRKFFVLYTFFSLFAFMF